MPSDSFTNNLTIRDFDHDLERNDLILEMYYQAKIDEGDASNLIPTNSEKKRL